jgi:hypothetical protein
VEWKEGKKKKEKGEEGNGKGMEGKKGKRENENLKRKGEEGNEREKERGKSRVYIATYRCLFEVSYVDLHHYKGLLQHLEVARMSSGRSSVPAPFNTYREVGMGTEM